MSSANEGKLIYLYFKLLVIQLYLLVYSSCSIIMTHHNVFCKFFCLYFNVRVYVGRMSFQ